MDRSAFATLARQIAANVRAVRQHRRLEAMAVGANQLRPTGQSLVMRAPSEFGTGLRVLSPGSSVGTGST